MQSLANWIVKEWSDLATHAWLVGVGASFVAYSHGSMTFNELIAALLVSAAAIIVPPVTKP